MAMARQTQSPAAPLKPAALRPPSSNTKRIRAPSKSSRFHLGLSLDPPLLSPQPPRFLAPLWADVEELGNLALEGLLQNLVVAHRYAPDPELAAQNWRQRFT